MSEVEKQESQKTVVAFITGLLIGGLLVWVFSSTPEQKKQPEESKTNTEEVAKDNGAKAEIKADTSATTEVVGEGSIAVVDQKAGTVVTLGDVKFPTKSGWVVVRELTSGVAGNVLGAARYASEEGLAPTTVDLVRTTVVGSEYQVSFYTNGGDVAFSLTDDKAIDGIKASFKAN